MPTAFLISKGKNAEGEVASFVVKPVRSIQAKPKSDKPGALLSMSHAQLFLPDSLPATGLLQIESFDRKKHRSFFKDVFKLLEKRKVEHLIVDLRDNGGGNRKSAARLLTHLIEEPFYYTLQRAKGKKRKHIPKGIRFLQFLKFDIGNFYRAKNQNGQKIFTYKSKPSKLVFRGRIFVLTDGGTASSSGVVASNLQQKAQAMVVGQESGGGAFWNNGGSFPQITLPNSKMKIKIPLFRLMHDFANEQSPNQPIQPDMPIRYLPIQKVNKTDLELKKIKEVILNRG